METLAEQSRNVDLPSSPVHSVFDHFYAKPTTSDLFEYLQTQHISEPASRFIMLQLMSIVQYLDSRNMVHRDIKDENIIIDHRTLRILLVDFGSIVVFTRGEGIRSFLGTLQYAAPEVLASKKYDAQPAEVWQIGCLLYIMLSSRIPFSSSRQAQFEGMNRIETYVSAWALDLVESMLVKDPKRRATISDIINHPWMLG